MSIKSTTHFANAHISTLRVYPRNCGRTSGNFATTEGSHFWIIFISATSHSDDRAASIKRYDGFPQKIVYLVFEAGNRSDDDSRVDSGRIIRKEKCITASVYEKSPYVTCAMS